MSKVIFIPEDYQPSKSNNYLKLKEGENKFRILSQPVFGWEDWLDKKPLRFRKENRPYKAVDANKPIKEFWAFIVWNYVDQAIQIMQITQATIKNSLHALCIDEDWGAPYGYDIKIIKTGAGKDTEYVVNPLPHKPLPDHVKESFAAKRINLEALFDNVDPFAAGQKYTKGEFEGAPVDVSNTINTAQITEINELLGQCSTEYRDSVFLTLKSLPQAITRVEDITLELFEKVKNGIVNNLKKKAKNATEHARVA